MAKRLSDKFNKLWVGAEILAVVLVGATLDIKHALAKGGITLFIIFGGVMFRMVGILLSLIKKALTENEEYLILITGRK